MRKLPGIHNYPFPGTVRTDSPQHETMVRCGGRYFDLVSKTAQASQYSNNHMKYISFPAYNVEISNVPYADFRQFMIFLAQFQV
jgi:hypothetical protein